MDKNPISFLQEYLMKRQIMPKYTVKESKNGTHLNWFKIRVECGQDFVDGEGSSIKKAKLNAAKGMIELLGLNSSNGFLPTNTIDRTINNVVKARIIPSNNNFISTQQNATTFNTTDMNINYIGRLQEMAQKQGVPVPTYKEKPSKGLMHQLTFTTVCKFNNMVEEASASNKKESKTLAAKKMFERTNTDDLKVCKSARELDSYLETIDKGMSDLKIHEDRAIAMAQSADKALKSYLPLRKMIVPKNVNLESKRPVSDYHTFLRDAFSEIVREHVMNKLKDTIGACTDNENTYIAIDPMENLKSALKELNIDVKEVDIFENQKPSIFVLRLNTDPVINQIGQGPTKSSAKKQSILQMAVTVSMLIA